MKPKYYISTTPRGSTKISKLYFATYAEALKYVRGHRPPEDKLGLYHIYPVDKSGYFSKSEGRTSFGEGNKEWEKNRRKK